MEPWAGGHVSDGGLDDVAGGARGGLVYWTRA